MHRSLSRFRDRFNRVLLRELDKGETVWILPKYKYASKLYHNQVEMLFYDLYDHVHTRSSQWWEIEHKSADKKLEDWSKRYLESGEEHWAQYHRDNEQTPSKRT